MLPRNIIPLDRYCCYFVGLRMTTSVDGFYVAYLSAAAAQGMMMLVFREGRIVGVDVSGGTVDGTYKEDADKGYELKLIIKLTPNVLLIQGGTTGAQPDVQELNLQLPRDFLSREFLRIETKHGPVNAKLVKPRELDG
jgi:hypothetical protein